MLKLSGILSVLSLLLFQEPRVREGWLLPSQAKRAALVDRTIPIAAVRLAVLPVEWLDLKHPDGWNLELLNLQFFLRGQYTQRNRLNQQPSGSLADWLAQNSYDQLKFSGKALNWVEVPWAWADVRGFGLAAPTEDELIRRAMAQAMARDGGLVFADVTHILLLSMGSRRDMDRTNPLWPRATSVKIGDRTLPVAMVDAGLLSYRQNLEQATAVGPFAHALMHLIGAPGHSVQTASWCLAAEAWHGDNAEVRSFGGAGEHRPYHLCAGCKTALGWIQPVPIDPRIEQKLALRPIETHPDALKILITADGAEHYLLENRQRRGHDRNLPGVGVLIWHVGPKGVALVPAHGIEVADAAWKFDLAVPFPTLATTWFSPETVPSSRRGVKDELRVVLGDIDIDRDGVAYVTPGLKAAVGERVQFEGTHYTIVPRSPAMTARQFTIALALVEFPDVPHATTALAPLENWFFRRGALSTARDVVRPSWTLGDAVAQTTGGTVALDGGLLSWSEGERRAAWISLARNAAAYQKAASGDLYGEAIAEIEKKTDRAAVLLDRADLVVFLIPGKARPNSAMAPHSGLITRSGRQIPTLILMEETALADPSPVLGAMLRTFKLQDKVSARAVVADGGKGFCFAGGANAQQNRPGPSVLCTWCRHQLGWLEPLEAGKGAYAIAPLALGASALKLPIAEDEHYLIENRTAWEFDRSLPREGLLIWHVTPRDRKCTECWENGVLDVWLAHDYPARGEPTDRASRHTPFISLPKKGFSLQLPKGGYELSGITSDARGNMYVDVDVLTK